MVLARFPFSSLARVLALREKRGVQNDTLQEKKLPHIPLKLRPFAAIVYNRVLIHNREKLNDRWQ